MTPTWQNPNPAAWTAAIQGLAPAVRQAAPGIMIEASQPMVAAIRGGIHSDTGLLAAGLKAVKLGGAGKPAIKIVSTTTRGIATAYRGTSRVRAGRKSQRWRVFYGMMVETGHTPSTPAHPFMRPAFDATEEAVGQVIEDELGDAIAAAWAAG